MPLLDFVILTKTVVGLGAWLPIPAFMNCGGLTGESGLSHQTQSFPGCATYIDCAWSGLHPSENGAAICIDSSFTLTLIRCNFNDCISATGSTGRGGAVYLSDGAFDARNCCLRHCDADRGAGFFILNHVSDPWAKIVYSTFIECAYASPEPYSDTGAVASGASDTAVRFEVDNLNFSQCYTKREGCAFSVEHQGSLLRFVSVENSPGCWTAIDFYDPDESQTPVTVIENCRFVKNQVSNLAGYYGTVYSSGGAIHCVNCYFKGNSRDFGTTQGMFFTISWITAEKCYFDKAITSTYWLTLLNCATQFEGTPLGLCIPAIRDCLQVQICTTAEFVSTGPFSPTAIAEMTTRLAKTSDFALAPSGLPDFALCLSPYFKESTGGRLSIPFASSISSHASEHIGYSCVLSTESPMSLPFACSVIHLSSALTESMDSWLATDGVLSLLFFPSVSSYTSELIRPSRLLSTHTPLSLPFALSVIDLSSALAESTEFELLTDLPLSITFDSSISSHDGAGSQEPSSLSAETQLSLPSADSVSANDGEDSKGSSNPCYETPSPVPFPGSVIDSFTLLRESGAFTLSIETSFSIPFASSVSSHDSQPMRGSSVLRPENPLSLPLSGSVIDSSLRLVQSCQFDFSADASFSLPVAPSVPWQDSLWIGDTSPLGSGLSIFSSSYCATNSVLSVRLVRTWYMSKTRSLIAFNISDELQISRVCASAGTLDRSSHFPFSGSEVFLAIQSIEVSISARFGASGSSDDPSFPFANSAFFGDSAVFDESAGSRVSRPIQLLRVSALWFETAVLYEFTGLDASVTLNPTFRIASSSMLRRQWELSVAGIPDSAGPGDGALASRSSSGGVVAGGILGAVVLCSAIGVSLFLAVRSRRKGSGVSSAEMDGDPNGLGTDSWVAVQTGLDLGCVFENQLDMDDGDESNETLPGLE
jgi:hypothetical protein